MVLLNWPSALAVSRHHTAVSSNNWQRTVSVCMPPALGLGHISCAQEAAPRSQHIKALGWPSCGIEEDAFLSFGSHCVRSVLRQCCWAPKVLESLEIFVLCVCFQSCTTFCDPMDCSPPGSSLSGNFQARILELVAMLSFRGSSQPRDQTCFLFISCIGSGVFVTKPPGKPEEIFSFTHSLPSP